jgi:3-oxoacyl-[acyl-carrier-protein] synthase II
MSAISSVGIGTQENLEALKAGRSGIAPITRFNAEGFKTSFAGEVKGFNPDIYMDPKDVKTMDVFIHYTLAAAHEAIAQSGLSTNRSRFSEALGERSGSIIGSGMGGLPDIEATKETIVNRGPTRVSPFFIPKTISNLAAGQVAIQYGLYGASFATTSACSSGAHAIGEAYRMIKHGYLDVAVSGGAESTICPLAIAGFNALRALSTRNDAPQKASRPFDKDRDGFVVGEGAGVLVLEEMESAKRRGAPILAELVGYAANCDAHHITAPAPEGRGAARAMMMALADAKLNGPEIGAINAHGTSTGLGDIAETQAVKSVFKDHAKQLKMTSTKSMIGHTLGAAGGIEAVYSILGLMHQIAFPTINLDQADPECDLDYVPNTAQDFKHEYALSNSFGFGGTNASLIFRRL